MQERSGRHVMHHEYKLLGNSVGGLVESACCWTFAVATGSDIERIARYGVLVVVTNPYPESGPTATKRGQICMKISNLHKILCIYIYMCIHTHTFFFRKLYKNHQQENLSHDQFHLLSFYRSSVFQAPWDLCEMCGC